jgi:hypothetical protein
MPKKVSKMTKNASARQKAAPLRLVVAVDDDELAVLLSSPQLSVIVIAGEVVAAVVVMDGAPERVMVGENGTVQTAAEVVLAALEEVAEVEVGSEGGTMVTPTGLQTLLAKPMASVSETTGQ